MNPRSIIRAALACALALALAPASALADQFTGYYLGGGITHNTLKDWKDAPDRCESAISCEDSQTGYKLLGGYRIARHWGAEAGWLGGGKFTDINPNASYTARPAVLYVAAAAFWPLPRYSLAAIGKLGLQRWSLTTAKSTAGSAASKATISDTGLLLGAGAQFDITPRWAARAEFDRIKMKKGVIDDKMNIFSLSLLYKFNSRAHQPPPP